MRSTATRVYHTVFNQNGLALVEVRQGRPEQAVRLVTEGMVYGIIGRLDDALADYSAVIDVDQFWLARSSATSRATASGDLYPAARKPNAPAFAAAVTNPGVDGPPAIGATRIGRSKPSTTTPSCLPVELERRPGMHGQQPSRVSTWPICPGPRATCRVTGQKVRHNV